MKREIALETVCFLIVFMFTYAATSKLFNINQAIFDMGRQPFPAWAITPLAYIIPAIEIIITALLIIKPTRVKGLYATASLLTIFTGYIILGLFNIFEKVPCSCGGIITNFTWPEHLVFNFAFIMLSLIGLFISKKKSISRKFLATKESLQK